MTCRKYRSIIYVHMLSSFSAHGIVPCVAHLNTLLLIKLKCSIPILLKNLATTYSFASKKVLIKKQQQMQKKF
jgi:sorbitol-specific phosphotransferase system component IIBC